MSSKQTDVPLKFDDISFDDLNVKDVVKDVGKPQQAGNDRLGFFASGETEIDAAALAPVHGKSRPWQRALLRQILKTVGDPAVVMRLWDGERITTSGRDPVGIITLTSPSALNQLLLHQDIGFGECYSQGLILVEGDLVEVLIALEIAREKVAKNHRWLMTLPRLLARRPRINTLEGSKANIHHHYDIGNQFYELWLDDEMQYTCAYFARQDYTLEQAQQAKMEHVCRKLDLKPGQTVVEAGCGWGGLARYMASNYGVTVKAYNISHEQVKYARERAKAQGLSDRVEYIEDDYRSINGQFDVFVSIGMLEHVGTANYETLGSVVDACLKEDGRGLIHTIGRNRPMLMNAWVEKRIFPGAYPPTLREMMDIFETGNFSVLDIENLRLHYATTLRHWLQRFEYHRDSVRERYDEEFLRAWRLYLSGSITAFLTSSLQLFQVAFARGEDNGVPWTREQLYASPPVATGSGAHRAQIGAATANANARGTTVEHAAAPNNPATRKAGANDADDARQQKRRKSGKRQRDDRQLSF